MSIIHDVRQTLEDLAFKQILIVIGHRTEEPFDTDSKLTNGAYVAGFLLSCCLIEACGHYLTGRTDKGSSEASFITFAKYLKKIDPRYNPKVLYKALRCGLVHNYTPSDTSDGKKNFYELVHGKPALHLMPRTNAAADSEPAPSLQRAAASGVSFPDGTTSKLAESGTYLNLQNLVFHLQTAMSSMFDRAEETPAMEARIVKCATENGFLSVR